MRTVTRRYDKIFEDQMFWDSVECNTPFTLMSVSAIMFIALLMALLLNEEFRGRPLLSAILLIPWAIPHLANGLLFQPGLELTPDKSSTP